MVSVASFVGVSVIICNRYITVQILGYFWSNWEYISEKGSPGSTHGNSYGLNNTGKGSYLIFCSTACATNPFQLCSFVSIFSIPTIPKSKIPLSVSTFNFNNYFQIKKASRNHTLMVYHVILNANNSNLHTIPFYSSSQTSQKLVTISLRSLRIIRVTRSLSPMAST